MQPTRSDRDQGTAEPRSLQPWALLPKEHGAYAELIFPLVTALVLGNRGLAPFLLASAAITTFLAHESFLLILGQRGNRARAQMGTRAAWIVAFLISIAVVTATLGLWYAPVGTLRTALLPLFSIALLVPFILSHREKTLGGEFLVALIFASALIPVARSGGVGIKIAIVASGVWFVIFALQTLSVRAVKAHAKPDTGSNFLAFILVTLSLALVVAGLLLLGMQGLSIIPTAAISPAALAGLACVWLRVHPRHLRTLGWVLVACDLFALALLTAGSG